MKIYLPGAKKLPKPGSNTKDHHTTQDDDYNSSHSDDQENNPGYGYSYRDLVPEYPPEIQNNIRIMGTHMVTRMCPPFLIHFHVSPRYIPKQAHMKKHIKKMRKCWSKLKNTMTQLHFIRFTEAALAYSLILAIIAEEIETLPTDL